MSEPTIEQMENLAVTLGFESILMTRRSPHYEEALRNLHALAQKTVSGDQEAAATLAALKNAFGRQE